MVALRDLEYCMGFFEDSYGFYYTANRQELQRFLRIL